MKEQLISGSNISSPSMKMDPSTIGGNSQTNKTITGHADGESVVQRIAAQLQTSSLNTNNTKANNSSNISSG